MSSRKNHAPCHKKLTCPSKKNHRNSDPCSNNKSNNHNNNACKNPCPEVPCSSPCGNGLSTRGFGGEQPLRNQFSEALLRQQQSNNCNGAPGAGGCGGGKGSGFQYNVEAEVDRLVDCAKAWSEKEKFKLKQFYEDEIIRKKKAVIQEFKCAMERDIIGPLKMKICEYEKEIQDLKEQLEQAKRNCQFQSNLNSDADNQNDKKEGKSNEMEVVDKALNNVRKSNWELQSVINEEKRRKSVRMSQALLRPPPEEEYSQEFLPEWSEEPSIIPEGGFIKDSLATINADGERVTADDGVATREAGRVTGRQMGGKLISGKQVPSPEIQIPGDRLQGAIPQGAAAAPPQGKEDMAEFGFLDDFIDIDVVDSLLSSGDIREDTKVLLRKVKELQFALDSTRHFTEEEINDLIRESELMEGFKMKAQELTVENEKLKQQIADLLKQLQNIKPSRGSVDEENLMLRERIQELEGERTRGSLVAELNLLKQQLESIWEKNEEEKLNPNQDIEQNELQIIPEQEQSQVEVATPKKRNSRPGSKSGKRTSTVSGKEADTERNYIVEQEPGTARNSIVEQEPGTARNSAVEKGPGTARNSAVEKDPGTARNSAVEKDPGTARNSAVEKGPGTARNSAVEKEPGTPRNSVVEKEPGGSRKSSKGDANSKPSATTLPSTITKLVSSTSIAVNNPRGSDIGRKTPDNSSNKSQSSAGKSRSRQKSKEISRKSQNLSALSIGEVTGPYQDEIKLLLDRIKELEDNLKAMAELEIRLKELEEQTKEMEQLQRQIRELTDEVTELRAKECPVCPSLSDTELRATKKKLDDATTLLGEKTREFDEMSVRLQDMEKEKIDLNISVLSFRAVEEKHAELENLHAQLLEEKKRKSLENKDLSENVAKLGHDFLKVTQELEELKEQLKQADERYMNGDESRRQLEREIAEAQGNLQQNMNEMEDLRRQIQGLESIIEEKNNNIDDLKKQLKEKENFLEELRGRNAALQDDASRAEKKMEEALREKEKSDAELENIRRQYENVQSDLMQRLQEQQKKCSEACDAISKKGQCILDHQKRCWDVTIQMERDNEELQLKLRQMEDQLNAMSYVEQRTKELHDEMEEFHKRAQERSRELEELKKLPETCDIINTTSSSTILPSPMFSLSSFPTTSQQTFTPVSKTEAVSTVSVVTGSTREEEASEYSHNECKLFTAQLRDLEQEKNDLGVELEGKVKVVEDIARQLEELEGKDKELREKRDKACKDDDQNKITRLSK